MGQVHEVASSAARPWALSWGEKITETAYGVLLVPAT